MRKRTAIVTGSFDPVTSGHENLFRRAAEIFDEVYAVIVFNTEKKEGMFSPAERLQFLRKTIEGIKADNLHAALHIGLTSDAAHELNAEYIVRGARNSSDFDYEYDLSLIMKRFDKNLETIIIPTDPRLSMISSTYVRDLLKYGCDLDGAAPDSIKDIMISTYRNK